MLLNVLTGKDVKSFQVDPYRVSNTRNVYIPPKVKRKDHYQHLIISQSPPFYGNWNNYQMDYGSKNTSKAKNKSSTFRKKLSFQFNSINRSNSIKSINKPLSNFDLLHWVEKLGIKYFRVVFSRDNLPIFIIKKECGIINLDTQIGNRTHWVCYRNIDQGFCEYFESFWLGHAI